jgi:hypothetical protein
MWHKIFRVLVGIMAIGPLGCGQASGDPIGPVRYPFVLTEEELGLARMLAERDWMTDSLASGSHNVFIKVDLLPDSQAESARRLVMVHHYRYPTDETIFTMIDLQTHEILNRETYAHYPTALATVEVERAIHLARADDRLRPLLETMSLKFEARPILYAGSHEPLFGHRVVHVLLRREGDYLMHPRVLVDLTTDTVHLE